MVGRLMEKSEKSEKKLAGRLLTCVLAMTLAVAVPGQVYAKDQASVKEQNRVVMELHHKHVGEVENGTGCYTENIYHKHEGNPSDGGDCYDYPVYHVHTGDEQQGGGCYSEEVYHEHEGNEQEGGSCYQDPVYHVHKGTAQEGGDCYQKAVYHEHKGSEKTGGECYKTAVYHKHSGNSGQGGGCYGEPVYHVHTGNAASKGGCYTQSVFHVHTGSNVTGGGCYSVPVYHTHVGNETSGGACYAPIYHQHTDSCYTEESCTMTYIGAFEILRTEDIYCAHHGVTQFVHFQAEFRHESCGAGVTTGTHGICWTCGNKNNEHEYKKLTCQKTEATIEGYQLQCGKGSNTVDAWQTGCNKTGATVDSYAVGCGKTGTTIESYKRNCNKTEATIESYQKSCTKTKEDIDSYERSCEKTNETVDSYTLSCPKDGKTIDAYRRNCEKDETFIDAYALSCKKNETTIEGYALGCKKDEQTAYGEFALWNDTPEWTKEAVTLKASCTDKGKLLYPAEISFSWEGPGVEKATETKVNGEEECQAISSMKVTQNGTYRVCLNVENEALAEQNIYLTIEVKNMDITPPAIKEIRYNTEQKVQSNEISVVAEDLQPEGSGGSGLASEAYSFDGGNTWSSEDTWTVSENGCVEIAVRDDCGNISKQSVEITNISTDETDSKQEDESQDDPTDDDDTEKKEDDSTDVHIDDDKEDESKEDKSKEDKNIEDSKKENPENDKQKRKKTQLIVSTNEDNKEESEAKNKEQQITVKEGKEEIEVVPEELLAQPQPNSQPQHLKKNDFTQTVVKAVAFTMSSVTLTAAVMYLIYVLLRSVRVYHQDGEGGSDYAGSCMLKKTDEGFEIRLPDMILEQSATGQFELRPGRIFVKRHRGEELLVFAGKKRESVWIDREIQLRIAGHA